YQAEIAQGRLEALLNYQTMVSDLTGLPMANASLLDEGTAAAEAMAMAWAVVRKKKNRFFASDECHPATLAVLATRAKAVGIELVIGSFEDADVSNCCGALVQYPASCGQVHDYAPFAERVHAAGGILIVAADLLSLTMLRPPAEFGADVAIGNSQRFGVPLGFGGPHAAFFATSDTYKRQVPGRIIGVSRDARGERALRMALQTREQHIRRDKATSNICTAQVLLAIMAGFYAVYHGPDGLRRIAEKTHALAEGLRLGLRELGYQVAEEPIFDTVCVTLEPSRGEEVYSNGLLRGMNLRSMSFCDPDQRRSDKVVSISFDETKDARDVADILEIFSGGTVSDADVHQLVSRAQQDYAAPHARTSDYLEHPVFQNYRSESEMLRYIHRLAARDLSLTTSMIPLGSCTMKLNGTSEMLPVVWAEFGRMHPFVPLGQCRGYMELIKRLEAMLGEITGFSAVSLQPNAGSQGEFAGMLVIRAWHESRGEGDRDVCLIPISAHGTNPASAVMAGMRVVVVGCDKHGNIDVNDLREKAAKHADRLSALMITYPSTHGVFESSITEVCEIIHEHGGQVYLDGANMNAQVGLCRPGDYGADVCHLNLHKTFAIPHGGGGPGVGPIGVGEHLAPFLMKHPLIEVGGEQGLGPVASAPWGSAGVLPISYVYIALMGAEGLKRASEVAILSANYMAARLSEHYTLLYKGESGCVAHEFIIDLRPFEKTAGIVAEDVAKRLMDYGFHAPTMSFPVVGTLMIEPTESESLAELDRFCDSMICIRNEIRAIEEERLPQDDNMLKNAPHPAMMVVCGDWDHPYTREEAAFPAPWVKANKFWPAVARIDNGFGDRNLICTCPPVSDFAEADEVIEPAARSGSSSPADTGVTHESGRAVSER
ncbi:MAG: glycine dehydrogenase, partial [Planctomycetota bacterium]